jgi:hypothetical protein
MANEIDFSGKLVQYGGQSIVLKDVPLGAAVQRIYARESTGWKLFTSGAQDFLNSKKILNDGDIVLVVPKVVPMDFPVKVSSGLVSEQTLTLEDGVQLAPLTVDSVDKVGSWKVASIDASISIPRYCLNGTAPAALTVNQVFTLQLLDVLDLIGEVGSVGSVRLIPNV